MTATAIEVAGEPGRAWLARTRLRWVLLAAGLVVGTLAGLAPYLSSRDVPVSDYAEKSGVAIAAHVAVGLSFLLVGALAWSLRPENRVGVLMAAAGFAYFTTDLGWITTPATFVVADEWRGLYYGFLFWLVLAFPSGRLASKADRIYVVSFFVYAVLIRPFPSAAFYDPALEGPFDAPTNPLLVRGDADLNSSVDRWLSFVDLALIVTLFVLVVRHWRRAGRYARRALTPVFVLAGVGVAVALVGVLIRLKSQVSLLNWGVQLTLVLLPAGFLLGLLRSRLARASVADLVVDLQSAHDPQRIRDALARALGDPALVVGYWIPPSRTFVDAEDAVVEVPPETAGRAATIVRGDEEPVAVLLHDVALADEPELVDAVAATARLALENQRLQAELRAQLDEVRASRARIVAAGDAERRRLERDLHDGAQQRLLTLGLALQLARAELPEGTASADELLADAEQELQEALHELRELARGIHPAILTDGGLTPALRTLAERTPIPVSVVGPDGRLPPAVETAAYFIVSETLTNVVKHASASRASVVVSAAGDHAVVQVEDDGVGGADVTRGSGLRGLQDRVHALGGRLLVTSEPGMGTCVRAELPCASSSRTTQ
jgi:signal transduction histidine kinase